MDLITDEIKHVTHQNALKTRVKTKMMQTAFSSTSCSHILIESFRVLALISQKF